MRNRRGSILVHVLITSVVVCVIAAGLAQMLIQRHTITTKATASAAGRKQAEASLNQVLNAWNAVNQVCAPVPGFTCGGGGCGANVCRCTLTPAGACNGPGSRAGVVLARLSGGRCSLTITSCP